MSDDDLVDRVRHRLAADGGPPTPARIAAALRQEGGLRADRDMLALLRRLQDELLGAGALAPLLREPGVTDVLVTAPDEVWIDRGAGLARAPVRFASDAAVVALVQRLAAAAGRRVDAAQPWVDARLPDGSRLHAVLAPVSRRGTAVSLRTLRRQHRTLDDLVAERSVSAVAAAWLAALVRARLTLVISGGTGTGKTTLLACLLGVVDANERVVVVEDSAELDPPLPHVVLLEGRPPNIEGAGGIPMSDLVRQAMRMRPDRLVVGETRGAEVVDMLAAFNTGHDGGLTTLHANSPADVPARIEALAAIGGLPRAAVEPQLVAGIRACVHLRRDRDGRRVLDSVAVLRHTATGVVACPAFSDAAGGITPGPAYDELAALVRSRGVAVPAVMGSA